METSTNRSPRFLKRKLGWSEAISWPPQHRHERHPSIGEDEDRQGEYIFCRFWAVTEGYCAREGSDPCASFS
jgi:hypothetical protein